RRRRPSALVLPQPPSFFPYYQKGKRWGLDGEVRVEVGGRSKERMEMQVVFWVVLASNGDARMTTVKEKMIELRGVSRIGVIFLWIMLYGGKKRERGLRGERL
ncbi:unnamed protein product, partial [Linum tenue]